jgi:hypothetical protein
MTLYITGIEGKCLTLYNGEFDEIVMRQLPTYLRLFVHIDSDIGSNRFCQDTHASMTNAVDLQAPVQCGPGDHISAAC